MKEFVRFGMVGTIGFAVDAAVLLAFVAVGASPLVGRLGSFLVAASVTFVLNHRFTFRIVDRPRAAQWGIYLAFTALGAFMNIGLYGAWVGQMGVTTMHLLIGAAIGSLTAMSFNFALTRLLVFNRFDIKKAN